jgi:hypothetical protein
MVDLAPVYVPGNYRSSFTAYHGQRGAYINWAVQMILYIVGRVGPREPASPAEYAAQQVMFDEMSKYCDTVNIEPFTVRPGCLMAWVYLAGALLIFATFLYNFKQRLLAFLCTTLALILFVFEFILYWEFIDPLYPAKQSVNVVGIIKPSGDVTQRIILCGHTDSMYEWWYNYLGGHVLFTIIVLVSLVGLLVTFICQIVLYQEYANWFAVAQLFWLPFYGALLFFTNWVRIVQGANDNLTGCMAAIGVAKYLSDNQIRFEHTEVRILTSGCEESGLRGAKAYGKQHPPDNIETAFIAFDTIRQLDQMKIYNRDMTATVALDQRVCNIMQKGGQLAGLNLDFGWIYFGSTDAAAAQQAGYPSGSFVAMEFLPADFYHTRRDNIENLDPYVIGHAIDLAIGSTLIFDQEGLNGGSNRQLMSLS